jgi:hypothetical protein
MEIEYDDRRWEGASDVKPNTKDDGHQRPSVLPFISLLSFWLLSGCPLPRRNNLYGHRNAGRTANKSLVVVVGHFSALVVVVFSFVTSTTSAASVIVSLSFHHHFLYVGGEIFPQSAIDHAPTADRKGQ